MIDKPIDERTIQFKFPLPIFIELDKQLQKHPLYQYAIDLLSKNKLQQEFQLSNSTGKVNNRMNSIEFLVIH
jgi:hypothetical protein